MTMISAHTARRRNLPGGPSLDELARACSPGPGDIVFISGSRLEGFGNEQSDYDIYVIQQATGRARPFVTLVLDGNYVVYETFSQAQVLRIAETLNGADPNNFRRLWSLSWFELELYYRVVIGRGLVNEPAFEDLRRRFHKDVIDACVQTWCGLRAIVYMDEAERKIAIGRHKGAYASAQQAMSAAVDSYLAAQGQSYPGLKWRFEKLQRLSGAADGVHRRAWDLKGLGDRSVAEYVRDVRAFCEELGMARFRAWSLDDVPHRPAPTAHLVTLHGVAYLVDNRNVLYELSGEGASVWRGIDGSTARRELIARATTEAGMAAADVDEFLFTLAQHGLIA